MAASRHMFEFGTSREQLAEVAVAAREWALLNPAAWEKKPLSIADVVNARPISDPLTVRDCCLVTDGGGAIVMTTADRARAMGAHAVYVLGCGQSITHATITSMPSILVRSTPVMRCSSLPSSNRGAFLAGLVFFFFGSSPGS